MWDMLSEPLTFSQLWHALVKRFDVDEEQCKKDISEFLSDLHREGLLLVSRQNNADI